MFSIQESLSFGWREFKKNWSFLVLFTLVTSVAGGFIGAIGGKDPSALGQFLGVLVSLFTTFTFARIGLAYFNGQPFSWKESWAVNWSTFGLYILGSLLFTLAYGIGLALLIIPGIIAVIRFSMFGFFIVEGEGSPWEALKRSFALTKGLFWKLLGFSIVLGLIDVVGILALGVGIFVAMPVTLLALAHVYAKLRAVPAAVEPVQTA
jgi:hypothetical protein